MVFKLKSILVAVGLMAIGITAVLGAFPGTGRYPSGFYYWSAAGSDSNNCRSPTTACQTIAKFNSFTFPSGTAVKFRGGDTFSGSLILSSPRMGISSYGVGKATISSGNSAACITATNMPGIIINNIICQGGGNLTNTTSGILIANTTTGTVLPGPTISNTTVTGYGANGIYIYYTQATPNTSGFSNIVLLGNSIHDNTGNYIGTVNDISACINIGTLGVPVTDQSQTRINNVTITGNTIFNCQGTAGDLDVAGDGIQVTHVTTALVANNLIHDCGANNSTVAGPVGIIFAWVDQGIMQFNEVYNMSSGLGDGEGLDFDSGVTNSIMQYNYIHATKFASILVGDFNRGPANNNNIIRFNITESAGAHATNGLEVEPGTAHTTNLQVYNNTFIQTAGGACLNTTNPGNDNAFTMNFSNNLCNGVSNTAGAQFDLGNQNGAVVTMTGNDWFSTNATPVGWTVITFPGVHTSYFTLSAFQAAGYEKVGSTPVGTTANPNVAGTFPDGTCGTATTVGWNTSCPTPFKLTFSTPAGKGHGLNLNSIYGFNVGTQDFYGNPVLNTTLPIGAAANQ